MGSRETVASGIGRFLTGPILQKLVTDITIRNRATYQDIYLPEGPLAPSPSALVPRLFT